MLEQSLNGARGVWQFREAGQGEWMPAEAPGCNYGDLLALGKIPDPFIGQKGIGNTAAPFSWTRPCCKWTRCFSTARCSIRCAKCL